MPGKQVSVLNSNMLKTRIAEPTLFITKKSLNHQQQRQNITRWGDHLTDSDDVFDQAVMTSQKWLTTNPFHSFWWSDLLEHIQCPLYI